MYAAFPANKSRGGMAGHDHLVHLFFQIHREIRLLETTVTTSGHMTNWLYIRPQNLDRRPQLCSIYGVLSRSVRPRTVRDRGRDPRAGPPGAGRHNRLCGSPTNHDLKQAEGEIADVEEYHTVLAVNGCARGALASLIGPASPIDGCAAAWS